MNVGLERDASTEVLFKSHQDKKLKHLDKRLTQLNNSSGDLEDFKKRRILIVDDQGFNIQALLIILHTIFGIDTDTKCSIALNGKEALNKVKESASQHNNLMCGYDLILMDCNMPFLDGYQATEQIREFLFDKDLRQPIITAITGHTEQLYVDRAIDSGMN